MDYYRLSIPKTEQLLKSNIYNGLTLEGVKNSRIKHGENLIKKTNKTSLIKKIFLALKEPMMVILLISFFIALFTNVFKYFTTGDGDFFECAGILVAILLSVSITLIMEGSSQKAFEVLNKLYDNVYVKVIRDGQTVVVNQTEVCVGDIMILEGGDKVVADGRIIESTSLVVDESCLTGESLPVNKNQLDVDKELPLAERKNFVYSGTFVTGGSAKIIVTAVGKNTEIGKIAGELNQNKEVLSPLQQKLASLGKSVSLIGTITAVLVFILTIIRLAVTSAITFDSILDLFISCIILVVAAVPEGLPTIVAVSLALNMIKLAKENALIKKMIATETAGAVSVICTDKTGTLTTNKMSLVSVCTTGEYCNNGKRSYSKELMQNFICNSTAEVFKRKKSYDFQGSGTECALILGAIKSDKSLNYAEYRKNFKVVDRVPFSSQTKIMFTTILDGQTKRELVKGAPEKVLELLEITNEQKQKILSSMKIHQDKARRIICFAHKDIPLDLERKQDATIENVSYVYDGYAVLEDEIRQDVYSAVKSCKRAGIDIKILTGDNVNTAYAVAKELNVATSIRQAINGQELEKLNDKDLLSALNQVSVIARSTPMLKLRIVKVLKNAGQVVAVTGDGINDAPAIKHADVGFAMGKNGSEITKESADVVLLDDSFSAIVKAITFGRSVFRNLQRFILFQLSVNVGALLFITICAVLAIPSPFNTLQLLWINVIMDGPPALTLGLEATDDSLMNFPPVKREKSIVTKKMLYRILFNGVYVAVIILLQYIFNFLGVTEKEKSSTVFTLFILFQLFNAFNSRELGRDSIFKKKGKRLNSQKGKGNNLEKSLSKGNRGGISRSNGKNKIMLITFAFTFLVQFVIVQWGHGLFNISPLSTLTWLKVIVTAFSIVAISETYKFVYRRKVK